MLKTEFEYNKTELGINAHCIITYKNQQFHGYATCHPDDYDFESEKTGQTIAEYRAEIMLIKHIRNNEIRPAYEAIRHLYLSLPTSKIHDPKSYESHRIRREYYRLQNDLAAANNRLAQLKENLKWYIAEKENFYQKIRKARNK